MIKKQGYVFIASFGNPLIEHLFGPSKNQKDLPYENLQSNRLEPFKEEAITRKIMSLYQRNMKSYLKNLRTIPAYLKLKIAENMEEARKVFSKSRDLVVIASDNELAGVGDILMGRRVEGKPHQYPLYGARMSLNGFAPIKKIESAEYIASEAARQGQLKVKIARFKLTRLTS